MSAVSHITRVLAAAEADERFTAGPPARIACAERTATQPTQDAAATRIDPIALPRRMDEAPPWHGGAF